MSFTEDDLVALAGGQHARLGDELGAHWSKASTSFAVWAPAAGAVSVVGDFNDWDAERHRMDASDSGVWCTTVADVPHGCCYKYAVQPQRGSVQLRADPFAFRAELAPATSSIVWALDYDWCDQSWMRSRGRRQAPQSQPISVYEVHLGSWRRDADGNFLNYREIGERLAAYCTDLGFTHVELLPVMEHPFYGSWGYQTSGYFAPTARYGSPQDLMQMIDTLHQAGIGVILDWVPSHFPMDDFALYEFDGTHLYEHADPRQGFHPDWQSAIFNYGRGEVRSFLLSSAMFWLDHYHVDGIRVDAVASMLYLDYSRADGEWIPNELGGRENLEAIEFLQDLNTTMYAAHPDIFMVAEESTAWPGVSRPVHDGGLGFGMKWDMGWMHDTLSYFGRDPVHRRFHHNEVTFRAVYQHTENFMLPLSHDEVVHMKGSLYERMPGDDWQKRANLRLLLANQWANPGKKLLFMGGELGQYGEWAHEGQVAWEQLDNPGHAGIQTLVADLNDVYCSTKALHRSDFDPDGFEWVLVDDADRSITAFMRVHGGQRVLCVFNHTPVVWEDVPFGVRGRGVWRMLLNTDDQRYGGSGVGILDRVWARKEPTSDCEWSIRLVLPPLGALFLVNGRA